MRENYGGFGVERQAAIYRAGGARASSPVPVAPERLEAAAERMLTRSAFGYVAGGAGGEGTIRANLAEFARWSLLPRMMTDVSARDTRVELFGTTLPAPLLFAPVGALGLVHPDAELALARVSAATGIPLISSTLTTPNLEAIATEAGGTHPWFQLYWGTDRDVNLSLVQRAEKAGYAALVLTVDTRLLAWRERDLDHGFLPFLGGVGLGNYLSDPVFRAGLAKPPEEDIAAAVQRAIQQFTDLTFAWSDIRFLSERTPLPILVKGILDPHDAVTAIEAGANGLIVSNHGGRQVDGSIPALRALPGVVAEAGQQVPVLFDSGIRRGADIAKALAFGARAVLLGRPYVWGLAVNGENGAREVAENILADFDLTMALCGIAKTADWSRKSIAEA